MAGPVRIEAELWDEWRVEALSAACGHVNIFETVGRLAKMWSVATDRETYFLPEAAVRVFLGPNGVEGMIEADLGERLPEGIRLKGSKRFDALWEYNERQRSKGKVGGDKSAELRAASRTASKTTEANVVVDTKVQAGGKPDSSQVEAVSKPDRSRGQAASNLLSSGSGSSQIQTNAREPGDVPPKPSPDWKARKVAVLRVIASLHADRFNAVRRELNLDVPAMGVMGDPAELALSALLETFPEFSTAEASCRHAIAIREEEARQSGSVQYFGSGMWKLEQFGRTKSISLKDLRDRGKPKPSAPRPGEPMTPKSRAL